MTWRYIMTRDRTVNMKLKPQGTRQHPLVVGCSTIILSLFLCMVKKTFIIGWLCISSDNMVGEALKTLPLFSELLNTNWNTRRVCRSVWLRTELWHLLLFTRPALSLKITPSQQNHITKTVTRINTYRLTYCRSSLKKLNINKNNNDPVFPSQEDNYWIITHTSDKPVSHW